MREITKTVLNIGLTEPVKILHITDGHLTKANEKDSERYHELMKKRTNTFQIEGCKTPAEYFVDAIQLAEEKGYILVNTGDAIDLYTQGCLEQYHEIADGHEMMFTPGGHEHQKNCVRTMEEPDEYYKEVREKLKKDFKEYDLDLTSKVVNGLNIVCADNSLDYYNKRTVELFKKELEKGLPMIVFSHDPIWDSILKKTAPMHPNIKLTEEDYKASHEMRDLLLNHPLVIATFGGHDHVEQSMLINGKTHYCTAGLFKGMCRYIEVR